MFQWPVTEQIVRRLLWTIEEWSPVYEIAKLCGVTLEEFVKNTNDRENNMKIRNRLVRQALDEVYRA